MPHKIFVISGPVAVGKTTIAKKVIKKLPFLQKAVSFTTRKKRAGITEDKIMKYVSEKIFKEKVKKNDFIEWAKVHQHYYGTEKKTLLKLLKKSPVLLNLDVQGALQIKEKLKGVVLIFIKPESLQVLKNRLIKRAKGKIDPQDFKIRIANVKKELKLASKYDYSVINRQGQLAKSVNQVAKIIQKELKA